MQFKANTFEANTSLLRSSACLIKNPLEGSELTCNIFILCFRSLSVYGVPGRI